MILAPSGPSPSHVGELTRIYPLPHEATDNKARYHVRTRVKPSLCDRPQCSRKSQSMACAILTLYAPTRARSPLSRSIAPNPNRNFLALAQALLFLLCILTLSALPPDNTSLVGYWSFDDGTGTQATDFSGRGNTGTLMGSSGKHAEALEFHAGLSVVSLSSGNTGTLTTNASAFPTWTNGKHNKALHFGGNTDGGGVDLGNCSTLELSLPITLSAL
jgi:hypothetical protein